MPNSKFNKKESSESKIPSILQKIMNGNFDAAQETAKAIIQNPNNKKELDNHDFEIGDEIVFMGEEGFNKGIVEAKKAGGNLFLIKCDSGENIVKYLGEIGKDLGYFIFSGNNFKEQTTDSKIINSISRFNQGKKYYGANIGLQFSDYEEKEKFEYILKENGVDIKCGLAGDGLGIGIFIYENDYKKLKELLILVDSYGYELFNLEGAENPILHLKDFIGSKSGEVISKSNDINKGFEIISNESDDDSIRNFSNFLKRCCLENGFDAGIKMYAGVMKLCNDKGLEINNGRILSFSNLEEYINGDDENIKLLVEFIKENNIDISEISYLSKKIQSPYSKNSFTYKCIYDVMGVQNTEHSIYPKDITPENVETMLSQVTEYYKKIGLPIIQNKYKRGYDNIFQYVMQYIGFKIDYTGLFADEQYAKKILKEFKKYGVDENDNYSGSKNSREKLIVKIDNK